MAEKPAKTVKKIVSKAKPAKILSDKEKVLKCVRDAKCIEHKKGLFNICLKSQKGDVKPLHSGLAKSESDAWKLAAHNL